MVCEKVRKFRKAQKKGRLSMNEKPMGEDFLLIHSTYGDDWADSMLMLMERLDELRQFTIDECWDNQTKRSKGSEIRAQAAGLRHIERELKSSIFETLMLMNDVRESLGRIEVAEQDFNIRVDKAPNTRRQFELGRRKRTEEDKKRRFIRD